MELTHRSKLKLLAGLGAAAILPAGPALAQGYPRRPVELIVPFAPGGGTDLVARAFADAAKAHLERGIGVVNRTGGGGAVGLSEIMAARPDGYKIGLGTVELAMLPHMGLVRFSADDFLPVARLNAEPSAVTVKADAPWKTLGEYLEHAKANPGKIRVGNSGTGAIWHLATEALADKLGLRFNNIPYEGAAPAVTALLGGHIEAVAVSPAEVSAQVQAGQMRILGVMAEQRLEAFPDVPTFRESGTDLAIGTWRGIFVPKRTPAEVVETLRQVARRTAEEQAFRDTLKKLNLTWAYLDGPQFAEQVKAEDATFKALMTRIGLAR
ncbi:Bug family tripartite tricarboxylate transporter substrate binding protein [Teichococcus aestuarii]|uniref:ABC transporter substrate-binding protein n=1 Tax=Teichococcus aestuarii TaxID=568898 RepID=A0A2U1V1C9_9PROT|nr:tripartite tricarboxylate transporter substrate binding protein [Pseudoroseomonas aestuarii]PWC27706.1 ABC transporter substrate-binding protein [Pseudoroseomonas aestuarii]